MARRNDIAPYERPEARRWTRVTDYVHDAEAHSGNIHWPMPGATQSIARTVEPTDRRGGLFYPIAAVALAAIAAIWGSGAFDDAQQSRAAGGAPTSRGLMFGL